jgi:hypothetical protein
MAAAAFGCISDVAESIVAKCYHISINIEHFLLAKSAQYSCSILLSLIDPAVKLLYRSVRQLGLKGCIHSKRIGPIHLIMRLFAA